MNKLQRNRIYKWIVSVLGHMVTEHYGRIMQYFSCKLVHMLPPWSFFEVGFYAHIFKRCNMTVIWYKIHSNTLKCALHWLWCGAAMRNHLFKCQTAITWLVKSCWYNTHHVVYEASYFTIDIEWYSFPSFRPVARLTIMI